MASVLRGQQGRAGDSVVWSASLPVIRLASDSSSLATAAWLRMPSSIRAAASAVRNRLGLRRQPFAQVRFCSCDFALACSLRNRHSSSISETLHWKVINSLVTRYARWAVTTTSVFRECEDGDASFRVGTARLPPPRGCDNQALYPQFLLCLRSSSPR